MTPSKKLYRVVIGSLEDGNEFNNFNSLTVIATDAISAAKRVRLSKNKTSQKFIEAIILISDIDKL